MAAEQPLVRLGGGEGTLAVAWDLERLRTREQGGSAPIWQLEGTPPVGTILRVLSASFEDGRALCIAGLRAADAEHDSEELEALLIGVDGEQAEPAEALVSTEYDSQGVARRMGLELLRTGDSVPLRVAADREALGDAVDGRAVVGLRMALDGVPGRGLLETIHR